jgi:hypothetical protein
VYYGLPSQGTLAALRHQLDKFLAGPAPRVPEHIILLEREKRDKYSGTTAGADPQPDLSNIQTQEKHELVEVKVLEHPDECENSRKECTPEEPASPPEPLADKTNHGPTPAATHSPKKRIMPWAKLAAVSQFSKSIRSDRALQQIKLMMGRPEPTGYNGTDTESDDDNVSSFTSDGRGGAAAWTSYHSFVRRLPRSIVPFTDDVVSGRWELRVTCHTMPPLPAPWRVASSKWLRGDMNIHLSGSGRSMTAEFALLGIEGMFKSRKCDLREGGICAWIRFVAQMPITTAKRGRQCGEREHNLVFGPSETQYGYLRFHGGNKVGGMLRCRKYGRLEFTGFRVGGPVDMVSKWGSFVE